MIVEIPFFEFSGSHKEIGRCHGEALKEKVKEHLDFVYVKCLHVSDLKKQELLGLSERFKPYITKYSPHLMDEIIGVSEGAGIESAEAVLLQIRQEVLHVKRFGNNPGECTTYAITSPYTMNAETFAGQNADLSGPLEAFSAVLRFAATDKPKIQMIVPAGQVSYIGMNTKGISACANFLNCPGWRAGYPRYMLSRLALEQPTIEQAIETVLKPFRASSRNLLLAQKDGKMTDLELAVDAHGKIEKQNGYIAHSNHFLDPQVANLETSSKNEISNSIKRYERMKSLIESHKGVLTVGNLKEFSKDHENAPDSICDHEMHEDDSHTFSSMILDLSNHKMHVTLGQPCLNTHQTFDVA